MYSCIMIPLLEDLEKRYSDIKTEVKDQLDGVLHSSKQRLQTLIIEQIELLDQMRIYYPHLYPYPKKSIFNAIIEDYKRSAASRTTINMIYDICSYPQFDQYKFRFYKKDAKDPNIKDYQAQGEKYACDGKVLDTLMFMDANIDNPSIQSWLQRYIQAQKKTEIETKRKEQKQDRYTIPKPPWLGDLPGRDSQLSAALFEFEKTIQDCAKRVWQYPPEKEEDDRYYSAGVRALNQLFIPGTDLKYVRDLRSYLEILYEKHSQSIHSAMSKSKIRAAITGEMRKLTREQIADFDARYILVVLEFLETIPAIPELCDYLLRYQKPYSAQLHVDRHEKLSESAFGSSIS